MTDHESESSCRSGHDTSACLVDRPIGRRRRPSSGTGDSRDPFHRRRKLPRPRRGHWMRSALATGDRTTASASTRLADCSPLETTHCGLEERFNLCTRSLQRRSTWWGPSQRWGLASCVISPATRPPGTDQTIEDLLGEAHAGLAIWNAGIRCSPCLALRRLARESGEARARWGLR